MQRVKLMFTRSQDGITQQYIIYRALAGGDPLPAYIVAHPATRNPIQVVCDTLLKDGNVYYASYGHIIAEEGVTVKVDGAQVVPVAIDYVSGTVTLAPEPEPAAVVEADYWFDGLSVIDTDTAQNGVTPLAPPAVDRMPPLPVTNLRLGVDASGLAKLEYDPPPYTAGTKYRYYVVAADYYGNRSWPSPAAEATLNQSLGDIPFIIERSTDEGESWSVIGETADLFFYDTPFFVGPMSPVTGLGGEVQIVDGESRVVLTWEPPAALPGTTGMYRVRTRSALNAISDPSAEMASQSAARIAVKYAVYRNAAGVMELIGYTTEPLFADTDIEPYTVYVYAVTAIDVLNNESVPVQIEIDTEDLIPPDAPELIEVEID